MEIKPKTKKMILKSQMFSYFSTISVSLHHINLLREEIGCLPRA